MRITSNLVPAAIKSYNIKPTSSINCLKAWTKDSFTPSFRGGVKLPLEEVRKMGEGIFEAVKAKNFNADNAEEVLSHYVRDVNEFVSTELVTGKNISSEFIGDFAHELSGSFVVKQQFKLLALDEFNPAEMKAKIKDSYKKVVNHVNKTCETYQFFLDNHLDREGKTIGINKVFKLMFKTFEHQAREKNIKVNVEGGYLLDIYSKSSKSDYKNYIIMSNLLGNAIKYSPENSTIKVAITGKNRRLNFSVRDKGIGILKEDQEGVLKQKRGSNVGSVSGTGYGLYRTSKLLSDEGFGAIKITSPLYPEAEFKGTMMEAPLLTDTTTVFDKIKDRIRNVFNINSK